MNRKTFCSMIMVLFCAFSKAQNEPILSKNEAWDIIRQSIYQNPTSIVYECDTIVRAHSLMQSMGHNFSSPDYDSWLFFYDDSPHADWEHPCRYVYVNIHDANYDIVHKRIPPQMGHMNRITQTSVQLFNSGKTNFDLTDFQSISNNSNSIDRTVSNHNYAVIISGGTSNFFNYERFWNNCSAIYSALFHYYGYPRSHIFVLMSDGTNPANDRNLIDGGFDSSPLDLDGDGVNDVQYPATPYYIKRVFTELGYQLTSNDTLFVFTTGHGGTNGGTSTYLSLWNDSIMTDSELAYEYSKVGVGKRITYMQQCHSGGFIDNIIPYSGVIMTACKHNESSYAMDNLQYGEFIYHWVSAVVGKTPSGILVYPDSNNDGMISMNEAFSYAVNYDIQNEHPQYSSSPSSLFNEISLSNNYNYTIEGPEILCVSSTYRICNIPNSYTVNWSITGNTPSSLTLTQNSPSANQCTITRSGYAEFNYITLCASIVRNGVTLRTLTKKIYRDSFSGTYEETSSSYNGHTYPAISQTPITVRNATYVYINGIVTLYSDYFRNKNLSTSGPCTFYSNVPENRVRFSLSSANLSQPFTITIPASGCDDEVRLTFYAITPYLNYSLNITPLGGQAYELSLTREGSQTISDVDGQAREYTQGYASAEADGSELVNEPWTLDVTNAATGRKALTKEMDEPAFILQTEGWEPGVYVVRALVGDESLAGKITVK